MKIRKKRHCLRNVFNCYLPAMGINYLYVHTRIAIRQQVGNLFGPLYKTVITRVKVFFVAHIHSFALVF